MKEFIVVLKGITVAAILLLVTQFSFAQIPLEGKVIDTGGNPVSFANVILLQAQDSSWVAGAVSDTIGNFGFAPVKPGSYWVKTSVIGYVARDTLLEVGPAPASTPMLAIKLQEDTRQLDEVVVAAQKSLYERHTDRTVVNVQRSITATGKSALEVLAASPGVSVNRQNNSLSMYGKNGVRVMINGKMSRLPIDAIVQMLDGMSAANIDKIELITSPPAKYDAEGDAGIIDIVTIENSDMGTNGNAGLTAGYGQGEILGGHINLNRRAENVNFFLDYSLRSTKNEQPWLYRLTKEENGSLSTIVSDMQREALNTVQNMRAGIEYAVSPKTTAHLVLAGYRRNWDMDATSRNINTLVPDSTVRTDVSLHECNIWQSASGSLGLNHQISPRQRIGFSADYLYYVNDNPSRYLNDVSVKDEASSIQETVDVTKDTPINFQVAQVDYSNQLSEQLSVDAGLKSTFSTFENRVVVNTISAEGEETQSDLSDHSRLNEKILAAYVSWDWKPTDLIKFYGGLRYEYTDSKLSTPGESELVDREFGRLFPSIQISKELSEKSGIGLAYARRITRPTFNDIAPFVFFVGPHSFFAGNPSLRPALSNHIDLNYRIKQWALSLKYSHIKNSISLEQPAIAANNSTIVYQSQNLKYLRSWGVSANFPLVITPWWEMQNEVSVFHQSYETSYLETNISHEAITISVNSTSSFTLPSNLAIELSASFQSKELWGLWEFEPMGQLNLGVKKKFAQDKSTLALTLNDILYTSVWKTRATLPENRVVIDSKYDWGLQSINLTYTRSFGNKKLKSVRIKSGAEDERKRVN